MNRVIKFRKKKTWGRDVGVVVLLAMVSGIIFGIFLSDNFVNGISEPEIFEDDASQEVEGNIIGLASIIDGDTIDINGVRIRLHGIDAPEIDQPCWMNEIKYPCGVEAKAYIQRLINYSIVTCQTIDRDRYGRQIAKCYNYENIDINARMVSSGNAVAYLQYSTDYAILQIKAWYNNAGIWNGHFIKPSRFREMRK